MAHVASQDIDVGQIPEGAVLDLQTQIGEMIFRITCHPTDDGNTLCYLWLGYTNAEGWAELGKSLQRGSASLQAVDDAIAEFIPSLGFLSTEEKSYLLRISLQALI